MGNKNYYETRFSFLESRKQLWPIICKYIQKFISRNGDVLDLACGYGDFINNIQAKTKYAIDLNNDSKKYLEKDIHFIDSDIIQNNREDDFKDKQMDIVFSSNFLEHLDDKELDILIEKIHKVLKKGGLFVIIQPNFRYMYKEYFDDYTHKKIFTHISLKDFLESHGFRTTHYEKKFLPGTFKKNFLPLWLSKLCLNLYFKFPFRIGGQMFLVNQKI